MIKTDCESCSFASIENGEQICKFGRLEHYKKKGVADKKDSGYYLINSLCMACRNVKYGEQDVDVVKKEIEPKITVIVDGDNILEDELKQYIDSGISQIIVYFKDSKITEYNKLMSSLIKGTSVIYRIVKFADNEANELNCFKYIEGNYILIGEPISKESVQAFKNALVEELKTYLIYKDDDSYIVSTILYKYKSQNISSLYEYVKESSPNSFQDFICER